MFTTKITLMVPLLQDIKGVTITPKGVYDGKIRYEAAKGRQEYQLQTVREIITEDGLGETFFNSQSHKFDLFVDVQFVHDVLLLPLHGLDRGVAHGRYLLHRMAFANK